MKLKVVKHKYKTIKNIEGKVLRKEYTYTVAFKSGFYWYHLRFRGIPSFPKERAREILLSRSVPCHAKLTNESATHFPIEGDAVAVMNDIQNNPDKYILMYWLWKNTKSKAMWRGTKILLWVQTSSYIARSQNGTILLKCG